MLGQGASSVFLEHPPGLKSASSGPRRRLAAPRDARTSVRGRRLPGSCEGCTWNASALRHGPRTRGRTAAASRGRRVSKSWRGCRADRTRGSAHPPRSTPGCCHPDLFDRRPQLALEDDLPGVAGGLDETQRGVARQLEGKSNGDGGSHRSLQMVLSPNYPFNKSGFRWEIGTCSCSCYRGRGQTDGAQGLRTGLRVVNDLGLIS